MLLRWLRNRASRPQVPRPARCRPCCEALEPRRLLSVASDFEDFLVQDEADIRNLLGDLVRLDDLGDVARLGLVFGDHGYIFTHQFTAFQGQGLAFANLFGPGGSDDPELTPGEPFLLLYQPTADSNDAARDVFPDFPYRFVGWAYVQDYDPANRPDVAGIPEDVWFIHEAGYHQADGGFEPTPPANDSPRGSRDLNTEPAGGPSELSLAWHKRFWDVHFFTDPDGGAPRTAIKDPFGRFLPGEPNGSESFFFPSGPFGGAAHGLGRIEAEDFDFGPGGFTDTTTGNAGGEYRFTNVDVGLSNDDGGFDVVSTQAGEFLQYTVQVPTAGVYDFALRMSQSRSGAVFHVEVDGTNRSGSIDVPNTGSFNNYVTLTPLTANLTAGRHLVRIVFDGNPTTGGTAGNLNYFSITAPAAPTAALTVGPVTTPAASKTFRVTYTDNAAVRLSSIDAADVRVTGPNVFNRAAKLVSVSPSADAETVVATYSVDAPGSVWDAGDNGTYNVVVQSSQVSDTRNNFVPAGTIGTFTVNVPRVVVTAVVTTTPPSARIILTVNGTDSGETITFSLSGTTVIVFFNGALVGNSSASPFGVTEVVVNAFGGADTVTLTPLTVPGTINGGDGNDVLNGGAGPDVIHGDNGNDQLRGNAGVDRLFGDAGDDTAFPDGTDFIDLGTGEDGVIFQGTPGNDVIRIGWRFGPLGPEVVAQINQQQLVSPYVNGETVFVFAGAGNDVVVMDGVAAWVWKAAFFGEDGADILVGGQLGDVLDGGAGHDWLLGRAGDDQLRGGDGIDNLWAGLGNDFLDGGADSDFLAGEQGDDVLVGGAGVDLLAGGAGADQVRSADGEADLVFADALDRLLDRDEKDRLLFG